jgi:SAM-dependent methyltransferase
MIERISTAFNALTVERRVFKKLQRAAHRVRQSAKRRVAHVRRVFHEFVSAFCRLLPNSSLARYCRRTTFQIIYQDKLWGTDGNSPFFSGFGSHTEAAAIYVDVMAAVISTELKDLQTVATIVDLGCGDFSVGERLLERLPGVQYVGCDVVPDVIEHNRVRNGNKRVQFQTLDIVSQNLPEGDICLVRQVFQHIPNRDIACVLAKLRKYRAVFVTEGQPIVREGSVNPDKPANSDVRFDWRTGRGRGVELDQPPWNLTVEEVCRALTTTSVIITHRVRAWR